jgi:GAF domain-containing protein
MREENLAETFVELADTLVAEFDVVEFLHHLCERCVELLGVDAVGLMLADAGGKLQVMASTSEQTRLLELFQLQADEGPCLECHRDGRAVVVPAVGSTTALWPRFAPACRETGFAAVNAIPLRYGEQCVGALNLFQLVPGGLDPTSARIVQALADVATIGLLQHRVVRDQGVLIEQLQGALASRVIIEQAKGVLAERLGLSTERAFTVLRGHARSHRQQLTELARAVIAGSVHVPHPGSTADGPKATR